MISDVLTDDTNYIIGKLILPYCDVINCCCDIDIWLVTWNQYGPNHSKANYPLMGCKDITYDSKDNILNERFSQDVSIIIGAQWHWPWSSIL